MLGAYGVLGCNVCTIYRVFLWVDGVCCVLYGVFVKVLCLCVIVGLLHISHHVYGVSLVKFVLGLS